MMNLKIPLKIRGKIRSGLACKICIEMKCAAIKKAFEHPQLCFVCDLAQKFIGSKFSYLLVSNPTHKTGAQ